MSSHEHTTANFYFLPPQHPSFYSSQTPLFICKPIPSPSLSARGLGGAPALIPGVACAIRGRAHQPSHFSSRGAGSGGQRHMSNQNKSRDCRLSDDTGGGFRRHCAKSEGWRQHRRKRLQGGQTETRSWRHQVIFDQAIPEGVFAETSSGCAFRPLQLN